VVLNPVVLHFSGFQGRKLCRFARCPGDFGQIVLLSVVSFGSFRQKEPVEGAAGKNPMLRRGYSRDRRPGCEQLAIALIVNNGIKQKYALATFANLRECESAPTSLIQREI
jgi:hypothetical protein